MGEQRAPGAGPQGVSAVPKPAAEGRRAAPQRRGPAGRTRLLRFPAGSRRTGQPAVFAPPALSEFLGGDLPVFAVQIAELDGFGNMVGGDGFAARQVGDGAGHPQ